jgi:catechol 1,2-dioxygenase
MITRRIFLSGGMALATMPLTRPLVACNGTTSSAAPRVCRPTEANVEGPYYRQGAPFRSNLADPGMTGAPLMVRGQVLSIDCRTPLPDAVLDVWQADADGHYDNDGTFGPSDTPVRLRGRVRTDGKGEFGLRTIVPGRYLNGKQYRPAHVHVRVSAAGHRPLTTQLYFPDDPYNASDPFIRPSLIMVVAGPVHAREGRFDFVLQRAV